MVSEGAEPRDELQAALDAAGDDEELRSRILNHAYEEVKLDSDAFLAKLGAEALEVRERERRHHRKSLALSRIMELAALPAGVVFTAICAYRAATQDGTALWIAAAFGMAGMWTFNYFVSRKNRRDSEEWLRRDAEDPGITAEQAEEVDVTVALSQLRTAVKTIETLEARITAKHEQSVSLNEQVKQAEALAALSEDQREAMIRLFSAQIEPMRQSGRRWDIQLAVTSGMVSFLLGIVATLWLG